VNTQSAAWKLFRLIHGSAWSANIIGKTGNEDAVDAVEQRLNSISSLSPGSVHSSRSGCATRIFGYDYYDVYQLNRLHRHKRLAAND
jgi:hypothetical protein